jgi:hypothetical protein
LLNFGVIALCSFLHFEHSSGCSFHPNFLEIGQEGFLMISRSSSNMGYLWSKTRSQELKIETSCEHTYGCSFDPNILEIGQEGFDDS